MARTPSTMLPLGSPAPDFRLRDAVSGRDVALEDLQGHKGLMVLFICNHCPFVIHVQDELGRIAQEALDADVTVVAINANDLDNYPQDGPGPMRELALELGWTFPYLFDETQGVAKAYRAACTPDFYLFDADHALYYRGQLDSSRPGNNTPVSGEDLRAALQSLVAEQPSPAEQRPSIGCNIKWKPGSEPSYYG